MAQLEAKHKTHPLSPSDIATSALVPLFPGKPLMADPTHQRFPWEKEKEKERHGNPSSADTQNAKPICF